MGPVHIVIFGIPVHAGLATGFLHTFEGGYYGTVFQQLVDINQTTCA